MKAIVCNAYSSDKDLVIKEMSKPVIREDEVLIRVMAATVASGDCVVRNANNLFMRIVFGLKKPRKPILGTDLAGVVEAVGKNVTKFKVNDHVIASTGAGFGCHSEYIALKESKAIVKIESTVPFNEAVTLAFGGLAGLHYLKKMKNINKSKILIYGASGAVGSSSVQLAKYYGFEVSTVSSFGNIDMLQSLGTDVAFSYTEDSWKKNLGQYDYIFDAVGKTNKKDWEQHLVAGGEYFTIANGYVKENVEDMELLVQLAKEKKLLPVIDKVYTMEQIVEAYKYVETNRKKGNVVLDFSNL